MCATTYNDYPAWNTQNPRPSTSGRYCVEETVLTFDFFSDCFSQHFVTSLQLLALAQTFILTWLVLKPSGSSFVIAQLELLCHLSQNYLFLPSMFFSPVKSFRERVRLNLRLQDAMGRIPNRSEPLCWILISSQGLKEALKGLL